MADLLDELVELKKDVLGAAGEVKDLGKEARDMLTSGVKDKVTAAREGADGQVKVTARSLVSQPISLEQMDYQPLAAAQQMADAANTYQHLYLSCQQAFDGPVPAHVCTLPCLGKLEAGTLVQLLDQDVDVNIFLPLNCCQECMVTDGEDRYLAAIEEAETATGKVIGYECELKALDASKHRGLERKDLVNDLLRVTGVGRDVDSLLQAPQKAIAATGRRLLGKF